jgi:dihydropteroate synthase
MGIVNVTPDSFSDGGQHALPAQAVAWGRRLVAEGADLLDIGGESTRPGSRPVSGAVQWERIGAVVEGLAGSGVPLSVDTRSAEVAERALGAGATIINDVSAGREEPALLQAVARHGATIILMHMQGTPDTMQAGPHYDDCVREVRDFLLERAAAARAAGIDAGKIWIDPGIGFGKTLEHNLELLAHLDRFTDTDYPVVMGASRKSFIARIADAPADGRLGGSLAALVPALEAGVHAVRVHDVLATRQFIDVAARLRGSR